jgi:protoheme IX farnesyltransferase
MMNAVNQAANRYLELTKPKVTLLNLLVGVTCFVLAAFPAVNMLHLALFCVAGYLTAGGCGALNCVCDQNIDRLMPRTSKRAIPSGAVTSNRALLYGLLLTALGIAISALVFNALTALMMVLGTVFYIVVYTILLKCSTSLNVVIGATAGCFAALSGWTAAVNSLSLLPLLVSALDFFWIPGHIWGLTIKKVDEYRKAGVPMLSVTAGLKRASQITFLFNVATIGSSLLLPLLGLTGHLYSAVAVSAGAWFLFESRSLAVFPSEAQGFKLFLTSTPYLLAVMTGLIVDKILFAAYLG